MKKIALRRSIFLPFILTSFFFLLPNVRAEEIELNSSDITNQINTYINEDFFYLKENLINNSTCTSQSFNYFIFFYYDGYYYGQCSKSKHGISYYNNQLYFWVNGGSKATFKLENGIINQTYTTPSKMLLYSDNTFNYFYLLDYISEPILYNNTGNSLYFNYNDTKYLINNGDVFPTLYDLYLKGVEAPRDNTPILTEFYSVVGSKIGWLGEQIIDNYVYLAVISVFILIFLIELIRRCFL